MYLIIIKNSFIQEKLIIGRWLIRVEATFSLDSIKSKTKFFILIRKDFKMSHLEGGDKWQGLLSENTAIKLFGFWIFSLHDHHQDCRSDPYWIPIWFLVQDFIESEEDWCQILCIFLFSVYYSRRSSLLLLIWNSWHSHFFSRSLRAFDLAIIFSTTEWGQ